ncbi:hypothetical protein EMCRGX_G013355 [Ephydatia muelleri]
MSGAAKRKLKKQQEKSITKLRKLDDLGFINIVASANMSESSATTTVDQSGDRACNELNSSNPEGMIPLEAEALSLGSHAKSADMKTMLILVIQLKNAVAPNSVFALLNLVWKQQISSAGSLVQHLEGEKRVLKCLSDTRWSARAEATEALSEGYDNIRAALLHIVQDPEQRADTQQEANGLHILLSYLDTVFMAVFRNIILERYNRVSMALQSAEIELGTAVKLLQSLQDFVSVLRGNFDAIEMRAKQKDPSAKYKDAEKRIRKSKTQFGDESNGLVLHQHDKFCIEVFLPILDKLSQALTLRTQAYDVVHKRFGLITEFLSMGADEVEKAAQNLQQCYPHDLELQLSTRVQTLFLFYRTFEFRQGNADMYIHMYSY